jgi:hypothetical protein
MGPDQDLLHRCSKEASEQAQADPRQQREHITSPSEASALPPKDHEERRWQGGRHCLAKEGHGEEPQSERVMRATAVPVESQVDENGAQVKEG